MSYFVYMISFNFYVPKIYVCIFCRDRTVFRLLEACVGPSESASVLLQRREDLKQRLVSKSALGEYMGIVFDLASYMIANAGVAHSLIAHLESASVSVEATSCSDLLLLLSKYSPQVCLWISSIASFVL